MAKAPVVTELPLQNVRFLFGTMVDLRMLPAVLEQTGRAEVGEFKLVAHFPADEKAANNEAGYLARHKGFRGGDYNSYHGDPYSLDEINWDATGRAGVHLVTKTKYGQVVEFPTIPDKNDSAELMLIVSEYVESIKTPPLIVRCSGIGGTISPLGNKKYSLSLSKGVTKCPSGIKDHVPKKYHAEDMDIIPYVGGAEIFSAESLSPAQQDFIGQQIARQMQGYYRTGVIGVDPVIGAYPNGPMSIAKRTPEAKQNFFREPAVQDEDGFWNKGPNRWQAHKIAKGVAYDQLERAKRRGTMLSAESSNNYIFRRDNDLEREIVEVEQYLDEGNYTSSYEESADLDRLRRMEKQREELAQVNLSAEDFAAEKKLMCAECDDYFAGEHGGCGCGTKTMNAPYAGRGSLMDIGKDTGLGSFTPGELATSSAIHGDFDQASLNYSGHQNLEVRGAEYFAAASTATPNLNREKTNLRAAIREEIDPNFEYSQCVWGPYSLRMEGANTNKFYMVFVYNNGKGVFRALGGYGGLAQSPRLFDVMTTRDQAAAIAAATKKLKAKERKGYFTYKAEEFELSAESDVIYYGLLEGERMTFGTVVYQGDYESPYELDGDQIRELENEIEDQIRGTGEGEGKLNFEHEFDGGRDHDNIFEVTGEVSWEHQYSDFNTAETGTHAAEGDMYPFSGGMVEEYANYLEKLCGNHWTSFQEEYYDNMDAEDIPVWNDGIVEWETSGPMSPTGSGYSSASAPPTGVIAGPGDTFLNYTEAQNYLVETSGGLYGAEHFEAMARIDPKNAQDVANVKKALKQRYKGIKINRIEYITNRRGSSNKYHVFAFTDRGVFNGYGRIGKTMTIYGPMSKTQGQKKMDTKMRRGGYKEQV